MTTSSKILIVILFLAVSVLGFKFGTDYQKKLISPVTTVLPVNKYILYKNIVPDIASKIYQTEIPSDWSAYSTYSGLPDSITKTYFGPSHFFYNDKTAVRDVPGFISVTFAKNKTLASKDISLWSQDERLKFGGISAGESSTTISVDGIQAKKYVMMGQAGNTVLVFIIKGDMIFSISEPNSVGDDTFEHFISTFKLLQN